MRVHVRVRLVCINAGMSDCPASDQPSTRMKKLTMPGMVWYRTKSRQSGIFLVRYRTEKIDAGMPMPALVFSMPMPSYESNQHMRVLLVACSVPKIYIRSQFNGY